MATKLLELGQGETFFACILWMQTAGQLGGLEPEAQGFGIHAEREATLSQRDKGHDRCSFQETHQQTRHTSCPRDCWEAPKMVLEPLISVVSWLVS